MGSLGFRVVRLLILVVNVHMNRSQRAKPVIVDPGLYMSKKSDVFGSHSEGVYLQRLNYLQVCKYYITLQLF